MLKQPMANHSPEFKAKILAECKKLTDEGKHVEASELFRHYFPDFNKDIKK